MKRWHIWALGVLGALVVAVAGGVTWLYVSFDPDAYRSRIEALASQSVGRQVRIDGPIALDLLPFPAVRLESIEVGNPSELGKAQLARIARVRVAPRPLALLAGRLAVGTVTISGLRMVLARGAHGQDNWYGIIDALAAGPGQALGAPSNAVALDGSATDLPLASLSVSALEINDAVIRYVDAARQQTWVWRGGRLQTGRMTDGSPFRLEISGRLRRADSAVRAEVFLMTRIEPHLADRFYRFSNLNLNVLVDGNSVPGGLQEASVSASGEADFAAGRYSLTDFLMQSGGLAVAGKIDGKRLGARTHYNGRVTIKPFSPRSVLAQFRIAPPLIRDTAALAHAGFDAQFEGNAERVRFKQIAAELDQSHLTGTASVSVFDDPLINFELRLDRLYVDRYLPPDDPAAATTAAADDDGARRLGQLWPALEQSRFDGTLRVGALKAAGLSLADAEARLKARPNEAELAGLTAAAYDGRLSASGRIEHGADTTRYTLSAKMRHIALGAFLSDLARDQRFTGMADIDLDIATQGRNDTALGQALTGQASVSLTDARLAGYDLDQAVAQARDASAPPGDSAPVTPIDALATNIAVDHGVARTTHMVWQNARFRGEGQGRYSLADDALDYRFRLTPRSQDRAPARLRLTGSMAYPEAKLSIERRRDASPTASGEPKTKPGSDAGS